MMIHMVLALCIVLAFSVSTAQSQPLFEVLAAPGAGSDSLTPIYDTGGYGQTFEVVVLLHSEASPSSAAEFVMTELLLIAPGVFRLNEQRINDSPLPLNYDPNGEYVFSFGACEPAGSAIELVRVHYGTFQGDVPWDTVIEIRGFQPGDTQPSSFDGTPGIVDCDDNLLAGRMGGHSGYECSGWKPAPPGSLIINARSWCWTPTGTHSFGALKSRY